MLLEAAGASNHMSIWCFKYTAHVFMYLKHFHFEALQEALHEAPLEKGTPPTQHVCGDTMGGVAPQYSFTLL